MRRPPILFVIFALLGLHCAPTGTPTPKNGGSPVVAPVEPPASKLLKDRIDFALQRVAERELETTYGFWTIFHAILGLGPENMMLVDPKTKERFKAIDYICEGKPVNG